MPTPVVMPQMGESIAEGTIVRWVKKVGDTVERDEPLLEISTDKVDAEVPAPVAGIVTEVKFKEGDTVAIHSVVAIIAQPGEDVSASAAGAVASDAPPPAAPPAESPTPARAAPVSSDRGRWFSPVVQRLARERDVDLSEIVGTGAGGRVTKQDVLAYVGAVRRDGPRVTGAAEASPVPSLTIGERDRVEPMGVMRRQIAERMVASRRTSAHVHSVFEVDFGRVAELRRTTRAEFDAQGVKLTYLAFIAHAVTTALREVPVVNAALHEGDVVYRGDVNLGIAVALERGLIVPVIRRAQDLDLPGFGRAIADLAERARAKALSVQDVQDGTFTITNPGTFGAVLGTPIINQPQVAILAVGAIKKRPVVVDDEIVVRPMAYLTLGFDHRIIDGAVADQFLGKVARELEHFTLP